MTDSRYVHLLKLMDQYQIKALALNPGPVFTYLTGLSFHLMERPTVLIITKTHDPLILLPELEAGKLNASRIPLNPLTFNDDPSTWQKVFDEASKRLNLEGTTIGVEPTRLRFLELDYLQKAILAAKFVSAAKVCEGLRIVKDNDEISEMRRAVQIAQDALSAVLPMIKPGITEKEIAAELTIQMLRLGTDPELPFSPIVASGPNSANPHAVPTERAIQNGDLLVIDWGARSNGYCSDLTRTFAIGSLTPELKRVYDVVQQANAAGRVEGTPEQAAGAIDKAARNVIESTGFGVYFTPRTGHGLGLEDHESPYIFGENEQILAAGMTYTVEPGIYLPGVGGVRIEDNIVVTPTGCESLSNFQRDLIIL
jgi:Xaa-Pro dipeptidase